MSKSFLNFSTVFTGLRAYGNSLNKQGRGGRERMIGPRLLPNVFAVSGAGDDHFQILLLEVLCVSFVNQLDILELFS